MDTNAGNGREGRCPSPGGPSLRPTAIARALPHAQASLPFTGRPFVEAAYAPSRPCSALASLPFTGRPFVEAWRRP